MSLDTAVRMTVTDQDVGITRRVIQTGDGEMPLVPMGTLLVHDKAFLRIPSERDSEFMQIRCIAEIASRHSDGSRRVSSYTLLAIARARSLSQPYHSQIQEQ